MRKMKLVIKDKTVYVFPTNSYLQEPYIVKPCISILIFKKDSLIIEVFEGVVFTNVFEYEPLSSTIYVDI